MRHEAAEEKLVFDRTASGKQALDRLCDMAAKILQCDLAVLNLRLDEKNRVIGASNAGLIYRGNTWEPVPPEYDDTTEVVDLNPGTTLALAGKLAMLGWPECAFFYRAPIRQGHDHCVSLIALSKRAREALNSGETELMDQLHALIGDHLGPHHPMLVHRSADLVEPSPVREVIARVNAAQEPSLLLNDRLCIEAVSPGMAAEFNTPAERLVGLHFAELNVSMANAIIASCRRVLETQSPSPEFEIITTSGEVFSLSITPVLPQNTRAHHVVVTARKVTDVSTRRIRLAKKIGEPTPPEPSLAFLQETLIRRRTIRSRKSISYMTLRSWRASIKSWQIKALRALKANIPPDMPDSIAEEMLEEIQSLVGVGAFRAIVPIPCSHSTEDSCLSLQIARALAAKLEVPVVQALAAKRRRVSSHPKENVRRPPMMLVTEIKEPVLLVDDVATSGAHIEEAVKLLRRHTGSVLAVAWISGDSG